jgi:hypothetical protein
MSDLNIRLDMSRIQSTVQAQIRPAVEEALATVDIKAIIKKMLVNKPKKAERDDSYRYMMLGACPQPDGPIIEDMVRESITEIAKQFVERELRNQQAEIEGAFRAMLATSSSKLARTFAKALQRGLESDWNFELDVGVKLAMPEKSDD